MDLLIFFVEYKNTKTIKVLFVYIFNICRQPYKYLSHFNYIENDYIKVLLICAIYLCALPLYCLWYSVFFFFWLIHCNYPRAVRWALTEHIHTFCTTFVNVLKLAALAICLWICQINGKAESARKFLLPLAKSRSIFTSVATCTYLPLLYTKSNEEICILCAV